MANAEELTYVFVNYLSTRCINACLRKILEYTPAASVVIDNSGEYEAVASELILRPGSNLGFGQAINFAIKKNAMAGKYFVLINPDVEFEANRFVNSIDSLTSAQTFTLALEKPSPGQRCLAFQKDRNILDWSIYNEPSSTKAEPALFLTGFHIAVVNTRDFVEIGGFDSQFFMYAEDFDLITRLVYKFSFDRFKYHTFPIKHISGGSYQGVLGKFKRLLHSYTSNYKFVLKHRLLFRSTTPPRLLALKLAAPKFFKKL
ncbi:MAG: hypothetical protein ACM3VZ_11950 [Acidobacteriota bacterium]